MDVSIRTGFKRVSNWQRHVIMTVAESKTRAEAAERLGLKIRTLDDLLYRAYKTMGCRNIKEAEVILGSRGFANRSD